MHLFTDINGTVYDTSCSSLDCYGWYFDFAQAAVPRIFSRTSQSFFICIDFFRKFHSGCLDVFSSDAVIYTLYIQNIKNSIGDNLTKSSTYRSGLRIST